MVSGFGWTDLGKRGIPPPPGILEIIDLQAKCDLIYGAQSLAGKILRSKDLAPVPLSRDVAPPP